MKKLFFFALVLLKGCSPCPAAEIAAKEAARAIIGEAASENYQTKLAIASAIRNRGTLAGVLGYRNWKMVARQPESVFEAANRAWSESKTNNTVHGATHFECRRFKTPYWARRLKPVATVGRFDFYKLENSTADKR